jgi:hypothetical protein
VNKDYRSSLDLVTDFDKQSSLKGSIFVYDADSSFAQEADSSDMYEEEATAVYKKDSVHPLVEDLMGDSGINELKKMVIYSEILQRKY